MADRDAIVAETIAERLEYLRGEIDAERISYSELAELQSLAEHIDPSDVQLLEWAGVPEFPELCALCGQSEREHEFSYPGNPIRTETIEPGGTSEDGRVWPNGMVGAAVDPKHPGGMALQHYYQSPDAYDDDPEPEFDPDAGQYRSDAERADDDRAWLA